MKVPTLTKYGFRIRTKFGLVVENLMIHGEDEAGAERKLRQMYHGCEVLECIRHDAMARNAVVNFEDVAGLIAR